MKLILLDRAGVEVVTLDIDPVKIAEAACVSYRGRYFAYMGLNPMGTDAGVRFGEVGPPVDVTPP